MKGFDKIREGLEEALDHARGVVSESVGSVRTYVSDGLRTSVVPSEWLKIDTLKPEPERKYLIWARGMGPYVTAYRAADGWGHVNPTHWSPLPENEPKD